MSSGMQGRTHRQDIGEDLISSVGAQLVVEDPVVKNLVGRTMAFGRSPICKPLSQVALDATVEDIRMVMTMPSIRGTGCRFHPECGRRGAVLYFFQDALRRQMPGYRLFCVAAGKRCHRQLKRKNRIEYYY
jgi:hypothetical protein